MSRIACAWSSDRLKPAHQVFDLAFFDVEQFADRLDDLVEVDDLDKVIKTIRELLDVEKAKSNLMAGFNLSELQAQAILDMRPARLAALERKKIEDEYLSVIRLIAELEDILANPQWVLSIIRKSSSS